MHAGYWFLILLILNTLTALLYLIWYLVFKQDKDNRIQYIMHTIVMILCPLVGPLYFLLGFLKYHFMKLGERDLSDVEFAKKRHVSRVKADEERERNIVPIEEAISISDQEKKRENMLNVLLGETDNSLASISVALDSDDSEVAHYAASFLQSKMDKFREHVRQAKLSISSKDIKDEECQEEISETGEIEEKLEEPEELEKSGTLEEAEESSELEESFYCPFKDGEFEQCAKIGLLDYNQLNPCDQGLLNNNFLRYGWRRYKHALIGKDTKRNCYILGVPGTYNRQEALMAGMFGFPYFKEAKCETTEMSAQEVQGHFGYWYRSINPPDGNSGNRS